MENLLYGVSFDFFLLTVSTKGSGDTVVMGRRRGRDLLKKSTHLRSGQSGCVSVESRWGLKVKGMGFGARQVWA